MGELQRKLEQFAEPEPEPALESERTDEGGVLSAEDAEAEIRRIARAQIIDDLDVSDERFVSYTLTMPLEPLEEPGKIDRYANLTRI